MNYTAADMARKLDISRSYLYYLKDHRKELFEIGENNKVLWDDALYERLQEYIRKNHTQEFVLLPEYKTIHINNRRFLGNKYKLLSFIRGVADRECGKINTVADIFAGTGAVASAFTDKKLITNDFMYSNYICHVAWFGSEPYSETKLIDLILDYNDLVVTTDNYMSDNFSDTYFDRDDCRKIGFIREDIEEKFKAGIINERERALLITSLLYAMDKIANTCGHYDAYRQGVVYERHLELAVPLPEKNLNVNNVCYQRDTAELMDEIQADLVYIDPPYNSRQYCDAYHLLENVARWEKPEVYGVARKMDRSGLKSDYCTQKATQAFEELIEKIHAKYILLSYNNMAKKGNDRSNAKIKDEDIWRILQKKGTVKVFEEDYKAFSTGKSDIQGNKERLFLCKCYEEKQTLIPSALNYTGAKYKLLPQMLPYFPKEMDTMVDLFCGSCVVGLNVNCNKVLFNDSDANLVGILDVLRRLPKEKVFSYLFGEIEEYRLSLSSEYGYEYYGCNSSSGLGSYNRGGYEKLKEDFNRREKKDDEYYLQLYLLMLYSFNNQLRFNRRGEFNLPVGKRDFNSRMQKKLGIFMDRIKSGDYIFSTLDFRKLSLDSYTENSFFYADPPYLITCATYNEQNGWSEDDERDMLHFLDELHNRGIRFALSNVLESKGKTNHILKEWIDANSERYRVIHLNHDYSNSNYHTKKRGSVTREILVVNY